MRVGYFFPSFFSASFFLAIFPQTIFLSVIERPRNKNRSRGYEWQYGAGVYRPVEKSSEGDRPQDPGGEQRGICGSLLVQVACGKKDGENSSGDKCH